MTISYNVLVSTDYPWSFLKIVFLWKGSLWKSIWQELCIWMSMFYIMLLLYRYAFSVALQLKFANLAQFIDSRLTFFDLTFVLGFFISTVVNRWNTIFTNIGFIDRVAFHLSSYIRGDDQETTIVRRNCLRYLCLTQVLVLRDIAISVRKRFPKYDSLVTAGFLMEHEKVLIEEQTSKVVFEPYWMPVNWVFSLCYNLRAKEKVWGDVLLNGLLLEVRNYRDSLQQLFNTDSVPIPLVYPQIVFLMTRVYFFLTVFSRQYIMKGGTDNRDHFDEWVPLMTGLQLIFYMGWLKVAEVLMNPLGMDDDDFECNYLIDRNIEIATLLADKHYNKVPKQIRDHLDVNKLGSTVHKLIGSAALVGIVEENMRAKMIPRPDYVEDEKEKEQSKSRAHSILSDFFGSRKNTLTSGSVNMGVDNPAMEIEAQEPHHHNYYEYVDTTSSDEDSPTTSNTFNHH